MNTFDQFGATYDFDRFDGSPRVYMIASTPRSGSHYLGHLLFSTRCLGSPLEYFNSANFKHWSDLVGTRVPEVIVREIMARRTGPAGSFGFKAHWDQFLFLQSLRLPRDVLRISRVVWIRRRDTLDQAISLVIAAQSGAWTSRHETKRPPTYDASEIAKAESKVVEGDRNWHDFFKSTGTSPRVVFYEDLCVQPQLHVDRLLDWFGLPPAAVEPAAALIRKQATALNATWKARYLSDNGSRRSANRVEWPQA